MAKSGMIFDRHSKGTGMGGQSRTALPWVLGLLRWVLGARWACRGMASHAQRVPESPWRAEKRRQCHSVPFGTVTYFLLPFRRAGSINR